jgi:hypothetical protein
MSIVPFKITVSPEFAWSVTPLALKLTLSAYVPAWTLQMSPDAAAFMHNCMVLYARPVPTSRCVANTLGAKNKANAQTANANCSILPRFIALWIKPEVHRRVCCFLDSIVIIPKPFPRRCSSLTATPGSTRSSDLSRGHRNNPCERRPTGCLAIFSTGSLPVLLGFLLNDLEPRR